MKQNKNYNKKNKGRNIESQVQRMQQIVARIQPELKHSQLSSTLLTTSLVNSTPQVVVLNVLSQGTSETTRIGDKARMRHLTVRLHFGTASSQTTSTMLRAMIVREKTTLGSALSPSQYFDSATPSPPTWQRNVTTRDPSRFVTLWDSGTRIIGRDEFATATPTKNYADSPLVCMECDIPLDFVTDYSRGNAGTVSDIDTNGLNLVVFTSTATANGVYCGYSFTLTYSDN